MKYIVNNKLGGIKSKKKNIISGVGESVSIQRGRNKSLMKQCLFTTFMGR